MEETQRRLAAFGYVAPAVSIGFLVLSTLLDPAFSWQSRSLSSIGEATGTSLFALSNLDQVAFFLFNSGLFLSGLLGLPFAAVLWSDAETRPEQAGAGILALTLLGTVGVSIAYLDGPYAALHFPAALTFFIGVVLTIWLHVTGRIRRTSGERGLGLLWLANGYVLVWLAWILAELLAFTADDGLTYFAVPEFAAAVVLGLWAASQARRLRAESASRS